MKKSDIHNQLRAYFSDKPIRKVSVLDQYLSIEEINPTHTVVVILEPENTLELNTLAHYQAELEDKFGLKTDLGTEKGLSPWVLSFIKNDIETVLCR